METCEIASFPRAVTFEFPGSKNNPISRRPTLNACTTIFSSHFHVCVYLIKCQIGQLVHSVNVLKIQFVSGLQSLQPFFSLLSPNPIRGHFNEFENKNHEDTYIIHRSSSLVKSMKNANLLKFYFGERNRYAILPIRLNTKYIQLRCSSFQFWDLVETKDPRRLLKRPDFVSSPRDNQLGFALVKMIHLQKETV